MRSAFSFACSMLLAGSLSILFSPSAQARWYQATSPHFDVYSNGDDDDLRRATAQLEDYDRLLRALTGVAANGEQSGRLKIYLVGNNADLNKVSSASLRVLGFYAARVGGTAAFAIRGRNPE